MWTEILTVLFLIVCFVTSDFQCPELEKSTLCACKEVVWWDNENKTVVDCSSASLNSVPNLGMVSSAEITKILLNGNKLSRVNLDDFKNIFVRELDLSRNSLSQLEKEHILHLRKVLTHLNLKSNRFEVDKGLKFIEGFSVLVELILDSNLIGYDSNDSATLPDSIFKNLGLRSLRILSLRSCGINNIQSMAFEGLPSLEVLDLTYNYLEEIPSAILRLSNLKSLFVGGNSIFTIKNNSFVGMILEKLVLDYNEIYEIEANAFSGLESNLKKLEFHGNYIPNIPSSALRRLKNLTFLKISKNNIQKIDKDAFVGMQSLQMLELDNNAIKFDNQSFVSLSDSLDTLLLRDTRLTYFPANELAPLRRLQTLDLSFNRIGPIMDADVSKLNLRTLILTNNNISVISPRTFKNLKQPIELDLDNNVISDVSFVMRAQPCSFSYVDLIGNPLTCDCDLEFVLNSGIMSGIGLTGHCETIHGSQYELGSSSLTRSLNRLCNQTERIHWCQRYQGPSNVSMTTHQIHFILFILSFIICVVFS
ncbi:hypothetical protein FSP39_018535 [Pinctada imbricata]|uniref:Uncharacterized protein n=1 Tax=Pinctada imbricata TaxID=66713 RepID=A0AA88YIY5_PINIB|nr:hypothetical protein FSP39_018535 [Pinctada imbricata]